MHWFQFHVPAFSWLCSTAGLYLTDDKSCIPDVQCYLCVSSIERHGRKAGAGRAGGGRWRWGVTLRVGGPRRWWGGGHQCTAAKLMPFPLFFTRREKSTEWWLTDRHWEVNAWNKVDEKSSVKISLHISHCWIKNTEEIIKTRCSSKAELTAAATPSAAPSATRETLFPLH